jgi:hypothetical protein
MTLVPLIKCPNIMPGLASCNVGSLGIQTDDRPPTSYYARHGLTGDVHIGPMANLLSIVRAVALKPCTEKPMPLVVEAHALQRPI